eukprot:762146-Hanusia_phi.AAC.5
MGGLVDKGGILVRFPGVGGPSIEISRKRGWGRVKHDLGVGWGWGVRGVLWRGAIGILWALKGWVVKIEDFRRAVITI